MSSENDIAIDFIDPLFAVVLSVSFAQVFAEPWFQDRRLLFGEPTIFYVATLFLAYSTVVFSWVGYHQSVKKCQINVNSPFGQWRFYIDIVLLIFYFVLLVSFKNFRREITVLAIIYVLYWVWDELKRSECPERDRESDSRARRGVTVFWFIFFAVLAFGYWVHPPKEFHGCGDWAFVLLAILGTIVYRSHKKHLWWKGTLLKLAFPGDHV